MRLQDLVITEAAGSKIAQLKLACKELGISYKLSGPFANDEIIERTVAALNGARFKGGSAGAQKLRDAVWMVSKVTLPKGGGGFSDLNTIRTLAPGHLADEHQLDALTNAAMVYTSQMHDMRGLCGAAAQVMDILKQMEDFAVGTVDKVEPDGNYSRTIAKANLKSLGLKPYASNEAD